eukprot:941047-Alexandrium_andersonii.AAC.2
MVAPMTSRNGQRLYPHQGARNIQLRKRVPCECGCINSEAPCRLRPHPPANRRGVQAGRAPEHASSVT